MTNMTSSRDNFDVCKIIANTVKYGGITMIFIIATINVIIGAKYRDDCRFAVPTYLMATGGGTLTFIGLWTIAECIHESRNQKEITEHWSKSKKVKIASFCSRFLTQFVTVIWGTIEVFGWYSSWVYDPNLARTPGYCDYTLYMYSFVMLVIGWSIIALLLCWFCIGILAMWCCPNSTLCGFIVGCSWIFFMFSVDPDWLLDWKWN